MASCKSILKLRVMKNDLQFPAQVLVLNGANLNKLKIFKITLITNRIKLQSPLRAKMAKTPSDTKFFTVPLELFNMSMN